MAAAQSDLERARTLYNAGMFDESIAAAAVAKKKPVAAPVGDAHRRARAARAVPPK